MQSRFAVALLFSVDGLGKVSQPFVNPQARRGENRMSKLMDRGDLCKLNINIRQRGEQHAAVFIRRSGRIRQFRKSRTSTGRAEPSSDEWKNIIARRRVIFSCRLVYRQMGNG